MGNVTFAQTLRKKIKSSIQRGRKEEENSIVLLFFFPLIFVNITCLSCIQTERQRKRETTLAAVNFADDDATTAAAAAGFIS